MRTLFCCLALTMVASACAEPGGPEDHLPTALVITRPVDSLGLGESASPGAKVVDARGTTVNSPITWSSSDDQLVAVEPNGLMTALRPGIAMIRAEAEALADSFPVTVTTTNCPPNDVIRSSANGYWGTLIMPGATQNAETSTGTTEYHGTPLFYGSGLVYGITPDTMIVGYDHYGLLHDITNKSGICGVATATMHTVSVLQPDRQRAPADIPGLYVVQDQYAFTEPGDNDYVLFRYTFTNYGTTPIRDLRVGVVADFDVYDSDLNVGKFDPVLQLAYVTAQDSLLGMVTGGVAFIDTQVYGYSAPHLNPAPTRADYYTVLANGQIASGPTPVEDVRQVLAAPPLTLNPGGSAALWYTLLAAANRPDLATHLAAARQRARLLNQSLPTAPYFGSLR